MRPVLCALAVLAVLTVGCSTQAAPEPEREASPASITPSPTPEPVLAPLTGLELDDERVAERPVLAIKVDNARPARPQVGLEHADIVFEELVEGGTTRFLALYQSTDPGRVGPVRSGREVDAELVPPFGPVLAMSGAAGPVYPVLRDAGLRVFSEDVDSPGFDRDRGRRSPHNLFVDTGVLWEQVSELDGAEQPWPIDEAVPAGGTPATSAAMSFSPSASASWSWASDRWERSQDGQPHTTDGGQRVGAANVVIVRVSVTRGGGVDSAGNPTQAIAVVGEGDGVLLRDGQQFPLRWRKSAGGAHFEWLDPEGRPLPLAPGTAWIELLPNAAPLTIESGAASEATP